MHKKDYLLIARAIRKAKPKQGDIVISRKDRYLAGKTMEYGLVVGSIMQALSMENPLFSKDKFQEEVN